jgi:hypothetical protein
MIERTNYDRCLKGGWLLEVEFLAHVNVLVSIKPAALGHIA